MARNFRRNEIVRMYTLLVLTRVERGMFVCEEVFGDAVTCPVAQEFRQDLAVLVACLVWVRAAVEVLELCGDNGWSWGSNLCRELLEWGVFVGAVGSAGDECQVVRAALSELSEVLERLVGTLEGLLGSEMLSAAAV